jgi:hypothetical protein
MELELFEEELEELAKAEEAEKVVETEASRRNDQSEDEAPTNKP